MRKKRAPISEETRKKMSDARKRFYADPVKRQQVGQRSLTHGQSHTPTYTSWYAMKQRCSNPNNKVYKYYMERGIDFCERWRKFENFLEDMGPRPEGKTLDRIDNDKGYSIENCRWATHSEQRINQRRMKENNQIYKGFEV